MSRAQPTSLSLSERLRYGAEAAGFFVLIGLFRILGLRVASALGGFLGREIYYRTPFTKRARANLQAAYPEKSDSEIETIVKEMCDNLGRTAGEYAHLEKFLVNGPNPRAEFSGLEIAQSALASGKAVMFVAAHLANWEVMPIGAKRFGIDGGQVYRPINNPFIDRWIVRQRLKNGASEQIAKGPQGTRRIFSLLRARKAVFLLVDQKTNEGIAVPFFGRDAMTTPAPAALALRLDAILVPISNERIGGARFVVTAHEPIAFEPTGDHDRDVLALTTKMNEAMEMLVNHRPSQWLWVHRRWPKDGDRPRTRRGIEALNLVGGSGSAAETPRSN
ncbi:MAG: lysophospholipid acyltransferase family protein [Rhizomicrobium sp.]|jgi:KDO2-lipid IV(A) lauroyltransferase